MLPRDEMQQITAQKSTKGNNMAQQLKTDMWGEGWAVLREALSVFSAQ